MIAATGNPPSSVGTFTAPPSRTFRKRPGGSETFQLTATQTLRVDTPSQTLTQTQQDRVLTAQMVGSSAIDYQIIVGTALPGTLPSLTYGSSNTAVLANPVNGTAAAASSGRAVLFARAPNGEVSAVVADTVVTGATTTPYYATGLAQGSLGLHLHDQIAAAQVGKTSSDAPLFTIRNDAAATYVRNQNCWLAGVNLTSLSVWNSATGNGGGGVLITPRHAIYIRHCAYHPQVGSTVRFVTANNQVVTATVDAIRWHPANGPNNELYADCSGFSPHPWDVTLVRFSADLPESLMPMKTLPSSWPEKLPTLHSTTENLGWAVFRGAWVNQDKAAYLGLTGRFTNWMAGNLYGQSFRYGRHQASIFDWYPDWQPVKVRVGDSGSPFFGLVNGEAVLFGMLTTNQGGPCVPAMASDINGMLTDLGGGYQLSYVDIGSFPTY